MNLCHGCDSRDGWMECKVCRKNFCVDCGIALTEICPNCNARICLECLEENNPNNIDYDTFVRSAKRNFIQQRWSKEELCMI